MYLNFYRLREAPFNVTPDPAFVYWSPSHKEALAAITHGVTEGKGFIAVTGEVGSGKTTMLRSFLERREEERVDATFLFDPELSFDALLRAIFREFDLGEMPSELDEAIAELQGHLIEKHEAGKRIVVLIDEAQRMPVETLERLRVLSNLETSKDKLLQIILCGQPELDEILERHTLRQLRQRIAIRAQLSPLTHRESAKYIGHRLECAGANVNEVFTPGAVALLARHGKGSPRQLNLLCDNALIEGCAERKRPVSTKVVKRGIQEYITQQSPVLRRVTVSLFALVLLSAIGGTVFAVSTSSNWGAWRMQLASMIAPDDIPTTNEGKESPGTTSPVISNPNESTDTPDNEEQITIESDEDPGDSAPATVPVELVEPEKIIENTPESNPSPNDDEPEELQAPEPAETPQAIESQNLATQDEPEITDIEVFLEVEVGYGDSIWKILNRVYGNPRPDLIDTVLTMNPDLEDPKLVVPGQKLRLPAPPESGVVDTSTEVTSQ